MNSVFQFIVLSFNSTPNFSFPFFALKIFVLFLFISFLQAVHKMWRIFCGKVFLNIENLLFRSFKSFSYLHSVAQYVDDLFLLTLQILMKKKMPDGIYLPAIKALQKGTKLSLKKQVFVVFCCVRENTF